MHGTYNDDNRWRWSSLVGKTDISTQGKLVVVAVGILDRSHIGLYGGRVDWSRRLLHHGDRVASSRHSQGQKGRRKNTTKQHDDIRIILLSCQKANLWVRKKLKQNLIDNLKLWWEKVMCGLEARAVDTFIGDVWIERYRDRRSTWSGSGPHTFQQVEPTEANSVMKFTHIFGPMVLRRPTNEGISEIFSEQK